MLNLQELKKDYAMCYVDKSRCMFIEKYLYTFNATTGRKDPFRLFPRQKVFLRTLADNRNVVAIKPRQCGITTLSSAWVTAQCVFASKDAPETVLCIANKLEQAKEIIIKIRDFLEQVPRIFWGPEFYSPDPTSVKNSKSIFIKDSQDTIKLFNGCRIIARASGPNAARGISAVSVLILDEAAFIEDGMAVYATASATMASNPRSKTVMVSTPNGKDQLYYNTYRQALAHENNFVAVEFRWYQDPRFNKNLRWYKKNDETGDMMWDDDQVVDSDGSVKYDEERWKRLEHDGWLPVSPWYTEMCKQFNNDAMRIAQELDVSFMGSSDNVVAAEYIEEQNKLNVREPLEDFKDPIVEETWFWKKPIDGHRYVLACLPQGEKVLTQRGMVNVEDVRDDDLLVTKEGNYTKIKKRMVRDVTDEDVVEIKPYGTAHGTKFTWNHPIWCSRENKIKQTNGGSKWVHLFDFINAVNVKEGDWLEFPLNNDCLLTEDELKEIWSPYVIDLHNQYKSCEFPLLNEKFWWYCGMWLAEGFVHKKSNGGRRITTSHNTNEKWIHDAIFDFAASVLDRKAFLRTDVGNGCKVSFSSVQLGKFLEDNFGKYAHGKAIPNWVIKLPMNLKIQLVKGYFDGDGSRVGNTMTADSVSLELLYGIRDILLSCGITSSVCIKTKGGTVNIFGKERNSKASYYLRVTSSQLLKYLKLINETADFSITKREPKKCLYLSDDNRYLYIKVHKVIKSKYTGKVYNFETEDESHTFCCQNIATHNCDPSRGTSADRTAIEIIDMDGVDEHGFPIIEQVAEYIGKKLGDDIGALCYQYATLYNDAFIVVDATGGQGDACLLTLLNMGYKNLYYEDMSQKNYTIQNASKMYDSYRDKLPGFHFQGNRYPVLSNFAGLVRNNEFKIRSARVINELDTWVFKGENGRMDHMDGAHDDTICALAMGLFVMQFSLGRLQRTIQKDKAILASYMVGGSIERRRSSLSEGGSISPRNGLPFYHSRKLTPYGSDINGTHLWLFGKVK